MTLIMRQTPSQASTTSTRTNSSKWYKRKRIVLPCLLVFPPLGILLLWRTSWPKAGKISGTALSGLLLLISMLPNGAPEPEPLPLANQSLSQETAEAPVSEAPPEQTPTIPPMVYEQAIATATTAVESISTAATWQDWQTIADTWQTSIDLLNQVEAEDTFADEAQIKINEYQASRSYALEQVEALQTAEAEAIAEQQRLDAEAAQRASEEAIARQQETALQAAPSSTEQGGYVSGSCASLRAMGVGSNFTPGDPNYTAKRDRDGDGVACES